MKTSFISNFATSQSLRSNILRMQAELVKTQKEMVTGRVEDAGLTLGGRTGLSVSVERDVDRLKGIIDSNELTSARLSGIQNGLSSISTVAQNYLKTLTAAMSGSVQPAIALTEANTTLTTMTSVLNTSLNGEMIFAGVNTDVKPINDFFAAGSPARAAIENQFQTAFGFAVNDAQANNLTAAQVTNFLDTVVKPSFMGTDWTTNWSNASDQAITARITLNETTPASVTANVDGLRQLAYAGAVVSVLFSGGQLNDDARKAVLTSAHSTTGEAVANVAQVQAETGIVEQKLTSASERLSMQVDIFTTKLKALVGVDAYEASTAFSNLEAQIEVAYKLTSRISQLRLVNYLS